MNATANTDSRAALERLMHEFASASLIGKPVFHQRIYGPPSQSLSRRAWEDFRLANYTRAEQLKRGEWDQWVPHPDGMACSRFIGAGDKASLDLFRRLADTGVALLQAASHAQRSDWSFDAAVVDQIKSAPSDKAYLNWLNALHLTAKQCRTLFLHVTVGNWAYAGRAKKTVEEVATAMSEPKASGLIAFPIHPIMESLQHDVFRSSAEAIKVWLAASDIERVGNWPDQPPIFLPPSFHDQQQTDEPTKESTPANANSPGQQVQGATTPGRSPLIVDRETFSAIYKGKTCELGNNKPFWILERLNHRPGAFVEIASLIDDVWRNENVEKNTVQRHVSYLREKLEEAFGKDVLIDGSQKDNYRLVLN